MPRAVILLLKIKQSFQSSCFAAASCGLKRSSYETRSWGVREFAKSCEHLEKGNSNKCEAFNYQELLQAELKYYKSKSHKYHKSEDRIKRRLESICDKYASNNNKHVMRVDDTEYFEDDGCIYRKFQNGPPEVVLCLDQLQFVQTKDAQFQRIRVSPNQKYLASSICTISDEPSCVVVKLDSEPVVAHVLPKAFSFEWATDNCLFYTILEKLQSQQVFRLLLGDQRATSEMVYKENDIRSFVELTCSKDGKFITINSNSKNSSEVWLIDRMHPLELARVVQERLPDLIYHVEHWKNQLYILTNFGASKEYGLSSPVQPPVSFQYSLVEDELYIHDEAWLDDTKDYIVTRLKAQSMDGTLVPISVFHKTVLSQMNEKPLLVHVYGAYGMDLNVDFKPEQLMLLEDGWILAYCHVRGGGELGLNWHKAGRLDKKHIGIEDLQACLCCLHTMGYSNPRQTALTASSAGGLLVGSLCNTSPDYIRAVVLRAPFLDVLNTMLDSSLPLTNEDQEEWGNPLSDQRLFKYIQAYCPYQNIKPQEFCRCWKFKQHTSKLLVNAAGQAASIGRGAVDVSGRDPSSGLTEGRNYPSVFITAYQGDQRVPLSGLLKYTNKLRNAVADNKCITTDKGESPSIILDIRPGDDHFGPSNWEQSLHEVARHYAFLYKELELDP
ncbi:prolyl endopeptidase-like isoform X4 [Mobula hypostoma]|uniref:prolyl endopeptidase-like isoform X4 n=1 Tax=Mobula hypostoma TaxID=723540 RepID=UPI002FC30F5B